MKNVLFTLIGIFLMMQLAFSQQVPRDYVVIEESTGFW